MVTSSFPIFQHFQVHDELLTSNSQNLKIRIYIHCVENSNILTRRGIEFEFWEFGDFKFPGTTHSIGEELTHIYDAN